MPRAKKQLRLLGAPLRAIINPAMIVTWVAGLWLLLRARRRRRRARIIVLGELFDGEIWKATTVAGTSWYCCDLV